MGRRQITPCGLIDDGLNPIIGNQKNDWNGEIVF